MPRGFQLLALLLPLIAQTHSLWADDVRASSEADFITSEPGKQVAAVLKEYFSAAPDKRGGVKFDAALDKYLLQQSAAVRKLAWDAYCAGSEAQALAADLNQNRAKYMHYVSPYVWRKVGQMPQAGWPLFIAMHGGGKGPKEMNDDQWQIMQHYYRDQPALGGYLYLAIRAPNDASSGFYEDYNLMLTDNVIRQFVARANVDSNKVFLMGYSHGGYGAFFIGPQMADRFSAIHASSAAPATSNDIGKNLLHTRFSFMIGQHDTMYGRLNRCQDFNRYMAELQARHPGAYPVSMQFVPGGQHSTLPDRDKIKDMYGAVRQPVPREVAWRRLFDVVKTLHWLHLPKPGQADVEATCWDNRLNIAAGPGVEALHVYVDERLVDYDQQLSIEVNGRKSTAKLAPSLTTLCETLAERGDRELMFATRLALNPKPPAQAAKK